MPAKMGRPKSDNPKSIEVKIRIDESTNKRLIDYCEKRVLTRTEAIRNGIERVLEDDKK